MSPFVVPGVVLGGLTLIALSQPSSQVTATTSADASSDDPWWTQNYTVDVAKIPGAIASAIFGAFTPYLIVGGIVVGYLVLRHMNLIGSVFA